MASRALMQGLRPLRYLLHHRSWTGALDTLSSTTITCLSSFHAPSTSTCTQEVPATAPFAQENPATSPRMHPPPILLPSMHVTYPVSPCPQHPQGSLPGRPGLTPGTPCQHSQDSLPGLYGVTGHSIRGSRGEGMLLAATAGILCRDGVRLPDIKGMLGSAAVGILSKGLGLGYHSSSMGCSSDRVTSKEKKQQEVCVKANAAVYRRTGNPCEVVKIKKLKVEKCDIGEIEVKMLLSPINPADINTIEGRYPLSPALPGVPGHEGVGEVTAVGPEVENMKPGDWVVPLVPAQGTWRTQGVFKAQAFHKIDNSIHLEAAAALCVNPPTALLMLEEFVKLKEGDVIVQNGANSAVGQMVIQLAHSMGVKSINIIRDRPNWDEVASALKAQGADVVTTEAKCREDARAAGLKGAVLGLNCVGGSSSVAVAKMMKEGGTHVTYGGMSLEPVVCPTSMLVFKDIIYKGFWLSGRWAVDHGYKAKAALLDRLVELIKKGDLKIEATKSTIFTLDKVQQALAMAQKELRGSKVYIKLQP